MAVTQDGPIDDSVCRYQSYSHYDIMEKIHEIESIALYLKKRQENDLEINFDRYLSTWIIYFITLGFMGYGFSLTVPDSQWESLSIFPLVVGFGIFAIVIHRTRKRLKKLRHFISSERPIQSEESEYI